MSLSLRGMQLDIPLLAGGAAVPVLSTQLAALNALVWLPTDEASGVIADNAAFTGAAGSELFTGPNAATDGTGEANATTGMSTVSATIASQSSEVYQGTYALQIDATANNGRGQVSPATTRGRTYTVQFASKVPSLVLQLLQTLSLNPNLSQAPTASWVVYTHRGIATTTSLTLRLNAVVGVPSAGDTIYGDAISIKETGQRDGYITGTVTVNQAGPGDTKAYDFAGGYVEMIGTTLDGLTTAEIFMLINPDTLAANRRIIYKSGEWDVVCAATGIVTATRTYSTTSASSAATTALQTGEWQWLRIQLDPTTDVIRLWIDDTEVTPASPTAGVGTPATNTNAWLLGSDATNHFDGKISNLVIQSTELSGGQWSNIVNAPNLT